MARLISFDIFDIESVRKAARDVADLNKWIDETSKELCRRLAELGRDVAVTAYADAGAEGNDDVHVEVVEEGNLFIVRAYGSQVYFVEFGAGVAAGEGYDTSVIAPPVDITPGSWSRTQGTGEFANSKEGYWHYQGERYTEIVPRQGMAQAAKEITRNIETIAKEVLK